MGSGVVAPADEYPNPIQETFHGHDQPRRIVGWRRAVSPLALLVIWQLSSTLHLISSEKLPPPTAVVSEAYTLITVNSTAFGGTLQHAMLVSLGRMAIGFGERQVLFDLDLEIAAGEFVAVDALVLADRIIVLADGRIAHESRIAADRPRDRDDPELTHLRARLLQELGVDQKGTTV